MSSLDKDTKDSNSMSIENQKFNNLKKPTLQTRGIDFAVEDISLDTEEYLKLKKDKIEQKLKGAKADLDNAQGNDISMKQQVVLDAERELKEAENRLTEELDLKKLNKKKEILEKRITGHQENIDKKSEQVFERSGEQLVAERELEKAKTTFSKTHTAHTIKIPFFKKGLKINLNDKAKEVRASLEEAHSKYDEVFKGNQNELGLEENKVILKKEAIAILERRISKLKTETFKQETKHDWVFEREYKRLGLIKDKWKTWIAKPENRKELKKRVIFSGVVAGALVFPMGGASAVGWMGARFLGSYMGGEGLRTFYNKRKTDYREKLLTKRSDLHESIKDLHEFKKGRDEYAEKFKKELAAGSSEHKKDLKIRDEYIKSLEDYREEYKQELTKDSASLVDKQNKWTKRWDRIGRVAGGLSMKGFEMSFDDLNVSVDASEISAKGPITVPDNLEQAKGSASVFHEKIIDSPEIKLDVNEVTTHVLSQETPDMSGDHVATAHRIENGDYENVDTGKHLNQHEILERQSTITGRNTMMDDRERVFHGNSYNGWGQSSFMKSGIPDEVKDLFGKAPGREFAEVGFGPEVLKAAGLEIITENDAAGVNSLTTPLFRNTVTGETYSWKGFYEKVNLDLVEKNFRQDNGFFDALALNENPVSSADINVSGEGAPASSNPTDDIKEITFPDASPETPNPIDNMQEIDTPNTPASSNPMDNMEKIEGTNPDGTKKTPQQIFDDMNKPHPPESGDDIGEVAPDTGVENLIAENNLNTVTGLDETLSMETDDGITESISDKQDADLVGQNTLEDNTLHSGLEENIETNIIAENQFVPERYVGPRGPESFSENHLESLKSQDYEVAALDEMSGKPAEMFNDVKFVKIGQGDNEMFALVKTVKSNGLFLDTAGARAQTQSLLDTLGIPAEPNFDMAIGRDVEVSVAISKGQLDHAMGQYIQSINA